MALRWVLFAAAAAIIAASPAPEFTAEPSPECEIMPTTIRPVLSKSTRLLACYETWSRCSRWSSSGTGRLWRNCNAHCVTCKGYPSGGTCVLVASKCWLTKHAWQCRCNGCRTSGFKKPSICKPWQ